MPKTTAIIIPFPVKTKTYRVIRPKHPSEYASAPDQLDMCWVCEELPVWDEDGMCAECAD